MFIFVARVRVTSRSGLYTLESARVQMLPMCITILSSYVCMSMLVVVLATLTVFLRVTALAADVLPCTIFVAQEMKRRLIRFEKFRAGLCIGFAWFAKALVTEPRLFCPKRG